MMHRRLQKLFLVCAVQITVAGCAATAPLSPFDSESRVWPEPPDEKRITYVGEFHQSPDLGIKKSAWDRLMSFAVGSVDDVMIRPMAVAATDDNGIVYVADPDAQCVHRYDLARARYECLRLGKDKLPVFPVGLDITDDGWLFVSDSQQGQLLQMAPGKKQLEPFYAGEMLDQPTGIVWDSASQQLYVTDTGNQSILVFDRDGDLKRTIGERGSGPGQFNFPTYLWVDSTSNEILVADSLNFRVQRFSADGDFLHTFGKDGDKPGDFSRPKGVATDSHGHVYVVDALMHLLQIFSPEGELLLSVGGQGQGEGQFWLPNGIFITRDNTIFVADSYNKRVQVFRYVGLEQ
jgi:DNA-binding beta-propeller fold protein YncE